MHGPTARRIVAGGPRLGERRDAGVIAALHAIPGSDGVGTLGRSARGFVELLADAGQTAWQVLPPHPPAGADRSPYDATSAFALDPLLVDLDDLVDLGLLPPTLESVRRAVGLGGDAAGGDGATGVGTIEHALRWKLPLARSAARELLGRPDSDPLRAEYQEWVERESWWLAHHVAFHVLRARHEDAPREQWPRDVRVRRVGPHLPPLDIGATHAHDEAALQFLLDRQARELRAFAGARGVRLLGDVPIYVGSDSADAWGSPDLFELDDDGRPTLRTGAPPDAFDPAGQAWAMPAYRWQAHARDRYTWWRGRLRRSADLFHAVRLDHWRAFADWWAVPAGARVPLEGELRPGPGAAPLDAALLEQPELDVYVEDAGLETPALRALREEQSLPAIRVLVLGFEEGPASAHLPTGFVPHSVACTSTHDTAPVLGWARDQEQRAEAGSVDALERLALARRTLGADGPRELATAAIEAVLGSPAGTALVQLQDWLGLGSEARVNVPGTAAGNWRWVADGARLDDVLVERMRTATRAASRGVGVPGR